MLLYKQFSKTVLASLTIAAILLSVPLSIGAQTQEEFMATIRTAILSDPRTAQMTEAEINQMVSALAQGAEEQGVTSYDITWRPQEFSEETSAQATCGPLPAFFCMLTAAFGLDGSDVAIPFMLMVTSGILLFVIGAMLHHRYGQHPVVGKLPSAPSATQPQDSTSF